MAVCPTGDWPIVKKQFYRPLAFRPEPVRRALRCSDGSPDDYDRIFGLHIPCEFGRDITRL